MIKISDVSIQPNTLYTIKTAPNQILLEGVDAVKRFLRNQVLEDGVWKHTVTDNFIKETGLVRLPLLPHDWNWSVVVQSGEWRGKIAVRIKNYYWKTYGIEIPDSIVAEIGTLASRYIERSSEYLLKFVFKIDWNAGDFGDDVSCFWGGRSSAKNIITSNGGGAIQFFDPEKPERGIGRCWFAPETPKSGMITIFNGYGRHKSFLGDQTETIAKVLAQWVNGTYHQIVLKNNKQDSGVLFVNNSRGFIIAAKQSSASTLTSYDLHWKDKSIGTCHVSRRIIMEGDNYQTINGRLVLSEYVEEHYTTCDRCGDLNWRGDLTTVHDDLICTSCYQDHTFACVNCGDRDFEEHMQWLDGEGMSVCRDCQDVVVECKISGLHYIQSNTIHIPHLGYVGSHAIDLAESRLIREMPYPGLLSTPAIDLLIEHKCINTPEDLVGTELHDIVDACRWVLDNQLSEENKIKSFLETIFPGNVNGALCAIYEDSTHGKP